MRNWLIVCMFIILSHAISSGQCDSTIQAVVDSNTFLAPILADGQPDSTSAVSTDILTASYIFYTSSDSTKLRFQFSEFLSNRRKLFLDHWCSDRVVNWSDSLHDSYFEWTADELRDKSRTRRFHVSPSDTLQFYRTYWWIDRATNAASFNKYLNSHTVSYSVELVAVAGDERIALLDTCEFVANQAMARPCINSWFPPLSRVRWIVPENIPSNTYSYIKVNMYDVGTPSRAFVRTDHFDFAQSRDQLTNSTWRAYNDSVAANNDCSTTPPCDLTVSALSSPSRLVVSAESGTNLEVVKVYTIFGNQIWNSGMPLPSNPTTVEIDNGLYIVAGEKNGVVTCTRKVVVP